MLIIGGMIATTLPSCSGFLDQQPVAEEPDKDKLNSAKAVEQVMLSVYGAMAANNLLGGNVAIIGEAYGDNVNYSRTSSSATDYAPFDTRSFGFFNTVSRQSWETGYYAVFHANTVIEAVDGNKFPTAGQIGQQYKGEALFARGTIFFELTRMYALPYTNTPATDPGIILRLTPTVKSPVEAASRTSRSTVEQCYMQIVKDLTDAIALLPEKNGNRASKAVAKAVLARVYFNMARYADAYRLADDVIKTSGVVFGGLTDPFTNVGDKPTNGVIFQAVNITGGQDASDRLRTTFFNNGNKEAIGLPISNDLLNVLRTSKAGNRFSTFYATDASLPYTTKYVKLSALNAVNTPYIRLAEMYLTRAEAGLQANLGSVESARADMNAVRKVAGATEDNATTNKDALILAIQDERRIELAMEGDRYHELRRLKKDIRGLKFNDRKGLIKLPDSEMRGNPNLEQN